jgi:hypothetical protein
VLNWRDFSPAKKTGLWLACGKKFDKNRAPECCVYSRQHQKKRCVCACVFACLVEETQDLATSGLPTSLQCVQEAKKKGAQQQGQEKSVKDSSDCNTINENRAHVYMQSSKAVHGPSTISLKKKTLIHTVGVYANGQKKKAYICADIQPIFAQILAACAACL